MDVNVLSFGVEFEVTMPAGECPPVGGYHSGAPIAGLPEGWNAQGDCSINAGSGYRGVEVVSPILKGADGIRQIQTVCDWLNANGAKVNQSTGFHVHVGFDVQNKASLRRLACMVANIEKALFAIIQHDLWPVSRCDSEVLGLLIERATSEELIDRCTEAVLGVKKAPLVMLGLWKPGRLVAIRQGNPLHTGTTPKGVYLASLADGLPGNVREFKDNSAAEYGEEGARDHAKL